MFLAAPGTQRQQMTDASCAKWRHVKLPQKDNKSWLQPAAMKHRCSALNGNIQKKRPKWSIWCVLCCRVSSLLWTLCCVRQAGGRVTPAHPRARLSPYREGRRREGVREGGWGYSGPENQPTGPPADLEVRLQRSRRKQEAPLTLTTIGWGREGCEQVQGKMALLCNRKQTRRSALCHGAQEAIAF